MGAEATENKMETPVASSGMRKLTLMKVMKEGEHRRALLSSVPTLTLGIIGGGVLPLSWAFSVTGIVCGLLIMVVVAVANAYTCDLLLKQAYVTGTQDFETLAYVIGGKWWKLATEISIVILLGGTLVGSFSQVGEVATIGLLSIWPNLPVWLVGSHGRLLITIAVLGIVAPLCLVSKLRQLEYAGIFGTSIVLWLMFSVIINSTAHGLPAIGSKGFAIVGFSGIGNVTQAVSIFGFAFYIQPMMMPLLGEMPDGKVGSKIVSYSTRFTVLVNAFFIYFLTGFFGAAYYGQNTASNILENQWLGGGVAQGILNLSMAVYLSMSSPVLEFATRHTIDGWIPKKYFKNVFLRHVTITAIVLVTTLALALAFPNSSGDVLVVTGATGVCMVSYLIPVVNHLLLHFNRSKFQKEMLLRTVPRLSNSPEGHELPVDVEGNRGRISVESPEYTLSHNHSIWSIGVEYSRDVAVPLAVLFLGIFTSVSSLSTLGQ